jgi:hypothetical protein
LLFNKVVSLFILFGKAQTPFVQSLEFCKISKCEKCADLAKMAEIMQREKLEIFGNEKKIIAQDARRQAHHTTPHHTTPHHTTPHHTTPHHTTPHHTTPHHTTPHHTTPHSKAHITSHTSHHFTF